jgi:hypothetical protein
MQIIKALSLSGDVNSWLAHSYQPRILHIFDRACNLINEHREVLSIVTPHIGNGPFNLVVQDHVRFSNHLSFNSPVSTAPNQLHLGNVIINTTNVEIWNPCPHWRKLHANTGIIADQLMKLLITDYKLAGLLYRSLANIAPRYSTTVSDPNLLSTNYHSSNSLLPDLSLALINADIPSAKTIASKLAGLGIGLTPAGDDFILGGIYAAWIVHEPEIASILAEEIANTAAPVTTSLSAAWLRSAGRGEAGIVWHEFLNALVSDNSLQVQKTLKNILAVGETSGADALAGFTGVFISWMEKAGSSHG